MIDIYNDYNMDETTDEVVEDTIPTQDNNMNSNNGTEYINHSGGANGADTVWGDIGSEYGVKSNHYYGEG